MRVAAACLLAMIFACAAAAQQRIAPSSRDEQKLDAILDQARARLAEYAHLLPNILCSEQGDSRAYHGDRLKKNVRFTAQVRMIHGPLPKQPDRVAEDATILTENGKQAGRKPKPLPLNLVGIFTNQDPAVLPIPKDCISYRLLPSAPGTIRIERWIHPLKPEFAATCASNPDMYMGERVEITLDAQTMQMIALERPVQPRRDLRQGWEIGFRYVYAVQDMDGRHALLPVSVHAETRNPQTNWRATFDASFSDYHVYGSTATILPAQ